MSTTVVTGRTIGSGMTSKESAKRSIEMMLQAAVTQREKKASIKALIILKEMSEEHVRKMGDQLEYRPQLYRR